LKFAQRSDKKATTSSPEKSASEAASSSEEEDVKVLSKFFPIGCNEKYLIVFFQQQQGERKESKEPRP